MPPCHLPLAPGQARCRWHQGASRSWVCHQLDASLTARRTSRGRAAMTADVARAARAAGLAGRATDVRDVEVRGTDVTGTVVRGAGTDVTGTVVRGADAGQRPDARRMLQLALAGLWLLDALLQ